jgi:two-component system cell cycle response regulator
MKILVADDSIVSRHLMMEILRRWNYEPVPAADGEQAWNILQGEDAPRLVILDWMMPGFSGLEVCRRVRQQAREPYTYIILLTSRSEKTDLVEGMEAGADDYVVKPFDVNELKVRLRAGRRIVELHAELLGAREALREEATRDSLTHFWNRRSVLEILERELARGAREARPVGVVMFDLDHFKRINDTHGHLAGDAVLREMAARISATLRPYDACGRYGGEEFLIVLPGCDLHGAQGHAERCLHVLSSTPIDIGGEELSLTASFGVTAQPAGTHLKADAVIRAADEALYLAKRNGRNRVEAMPGLEPAGAAGG